MQSAGGGGCPVLFFSKTGGIRGQRGLTQGCQERSSPVMVHLGNKSRAGFQAGICDPGAIDHEMLLIRRQLC